ncbi:MAG: hypothetical protein U0263_36130 [Polyangiaceae bacterium]
MTLPLPVVYQGSVTVPNPDFERGRAHHHGARLVDPRLHLH